MSVVTITRFRTEPGRFADHLALHLEALQRLRGLGMQAIAMQPLAGGDVGSLVMSVNYDTTADYVSSLQKAQADSGWQEFYANAMASGAATQVEASIFNDLDPSFRADASRPLGAVLGFQWRARPGRMEDFIGNVMDSIPHIERLGGSGRQMQSAVGAHPMTMLTTVGFADLDAYGEYTDKLGTDAEFQAYWAEVMKDPTADLVRSGLYLNISDG